MMRMLISRKSRLYRWFSLSLVVFLLSCSTGNVQALPTAAAPTGDAVPTGGTSALSASAEEKIYLPMIRKPTAKFFGIYMDQYWNIENVRTYMSIADQAAGKKHSSVGWFIALEDDAFTIPVDNLPKNNLYRQLEELWKYGYISFVNLDTDATSAQINSGQRDSLIRTAARYYKAWLSLGGGRKAMIAPLQEMNGDWTSYSQEGTTPDQVKQAFRRIVTIFYQEGIRRDQVWWVFAPNAWNPDNQPWRAFENYYPGDDVIDFVGFSSYNYGFCPSTVVVSGKWETYREIFEPHIKRMKAMAPSKPLIIAETATTSYYELKKSDESRKDQWLIESYNYLALQPDVVGVFYFSHTEFEHTDASDMRYCDFEVAKKDYQSAGYRQGLANPIYSYLTVPEIEHFVP